MAKATALTGKVKFTNTGKSQYRVETLINSKRTRWQQTFKSYEEALAYIEQQKQRPWQNDTRFLVTEITTRTLGVF